MAPVKNGLFLFLRERDERREETLAAVSRFGFPKRSGILLNGFFCNVGFIVCSARFNTTARSLLLVKKLWFLTRSRHRDSLNKPKPSAAETSLLVSIVEAPVYAIISQYKPPQAHGITAWSRFSMVNQGWPRLSPSTAR